MDQITTTIRVAALQAACSESIDSGALDTWPEFFTEDGQYLVLSRENFDRGRTGYTIACFNRSMMRDRVVSLHEANIYSEQYYTHVQGFPVVTVGEGGEIAATTRYTVMRTEVLTGRASVFSVGRFEDRIVEEGGALKFKSRTVVFDNDLVETLLALPV